MSAAPLRSLSVALLALAFGTATTGPAGAQVASEARIHPSIPLLDAQGTNVLRSGGPISLQRTCGACHDVDYITTHTLHAGPGLDATVFPLAQISSRPWTPPQATGTEMNCLLCHTPEPADDARLQAIADGDGVWAATATLSGTPIVLPDGTGWRWNPQAFDARGNVLDSLLGLQGPTTRNCAQCHGLAGDDMKEPVVLEGLGPGDLQTLATGEIFSPQRISDSGLNLVGKQDLHRPWDVHAERLLECTNCHYSVNDPLYRKEPDDSRPKGLIFDSRRMPLGAYLQRPNHNLAGQSAWVGQTHDGEALSCTTCHDPRPTHEWLPYAKRHMDALACETCHAPTMHSVAVRSVDWTSLDEDGNPSVTWRGCTAGCETAATDLVRGWEPTLLARTDADGTTRLAPYNLVTSWYWVSGADEVPVDLQLVLSASQGGDVAVRLRDLGVEDPRIVSEIRPYAIHHGMAAGTGATRDCQTCHDEDSRLAQGFALGRPPQGAEPARLVDDESVALTGAIEQGADGALWLAPRTSTSSLHVLGHDRVWWVDLLGMAMVLGTLLGAVVHAVLRWRASRALPLQADRQGPPVYMYPTYERIWHWLQALAIIALLLTGIEIHVTRTGIVDFAVAVRLHNILGFVVVGNAIFAALYHLASGEIRQYLPRPRGFFAQAIDQASFYLSGIFRGHDHPFEKSPERKLNPLQQVTYLAILNVLLPLQIVSGLLMWGAQRWPAVDGMLGGLVFLAPVHALGAWAFAAFLVLHVYLTTTGATPTANIRAMVGGWEGAPTAERRAE